MPLTQTSRLLGIATPLGDDAVVLLRMSGTEQLSRLFEYNLELLSEDADLKADDILGKNITVRLEVGEDTTRYFNGHVSSFSWAGFRGRLNLYQATVRPWMWFLTRTADCRIFQEMTVPDIIKKLFRDLGLTDFKESLSGQYRTWEYCVQYRETDFNFVSRLMEQEGIYYYFKHENGKHTLVMCDDTGSHETVAGYEKVPFFPPDDQMRRERDHIFDWTFSHEVQSGVYALNDFDFKVPKKSLRSTASIPREHAQSEFEIYDFPGEYTESGDGDSYTEIRIQELQTSYERARAMGNTRGLGSGALFKLTDFPREDQNRQYLIVSASYELQSDEFQVGSGISSAPLYQCSYEVMDARQPYRAPRITPKPVIQGPQTAIVVGPSGEEIHSDEYGRVKCQFHWDRYGKADENSSCWIRVAQLWAGKRWGAMFLPRIGQEVLVEFLEGDPDHPMISGRVYNGENKVPYDLPANETMSTIKSNSSKGGKGFNELRFEDKKGEEQVYLHAEKNLDIRVKNDRYENIGNDRHLVVERHKHEHVKKERHEVVDEHHYEQICQDRNLEVGGKESKKVKGNSSLTVGGNIDEKCKGDFGLEVTGDYYVKAANIVLEGMTNVTIKVGQSYIAIEAGGIKIGTMGTLELESTGQLSAKGTAGLKLETPAMAEMQGTMTTVKASGVLTLQGALVKIN